MARLSELLDAAKLRRLADLMDELDRRRVAEFGPEAHETQIQDDLRCWADGVERGLIV